MTGNFRLMIRTLRKQHEQRQAFKELISASNELLSTFQAARENWDTAALDEIEPAVNDLLQKTVAAEKTLNGDTP